MPYYCTVPRCTSMAGKVKNVSFHQFPRDEELAKLWNKILKRGKPYTKYSKVCSLHFTPEDYTITNAGKYKGQWRTLRKDAIPSRNLPTEAPSPYQRRASWSPVANSIDPRLHQQMAQAIYVQTMLAMQAASVTDVGGSMFTNDQQMSSPNEDNSRSPTNNTSDQITFNYDHFDKMLNQPKDKQTDATDSSNSNTDLDNTENDVVNPNINVASNINTSFGNRSKETFKCNECSKCFKDPDVFLLHRRIHNKSPLKSVENESPDEGSSDNTQETLKANPILANLLRSGVPQGNVLGQGDQDVGKPFDNNIVSIESQIMTALAANMENYLRNLSTIMTSSTLVNSRITTESTQGENDIEDDALDNDAIESAQGVNDLDDKSDNNVEENGPNPDEVDDKIDDCDKKDFDDSQDSAKLVIDEETC